MAFTKTYKCMNIGNCELANKKETFEVPEGETAVCPKCGSTMLVEVKKGGKGLIYGIIAALVAVAAAVVLFLTGVFGGGSKEEPVIDETVVEEPVEEVPVDSVAVVDAEEETPAVEEEPKSEEGAAIETAPTTAPAQPTTYNLGYGIYTGPMQGGKPAGYNGVIKITKDHTFVQGNMDRTQVAASAGDQVVDCKFSNGRLVSGQLLRKDGTRMNLNLGNI